MGGPYFSSEGSGSNYLCMPDDAQYGGDGYESEERLLGWIYAATYQTSSYNDENSPLANGKDIHDKDIPCTVCLSENPSLVMIPAHVS